MSALHGPIHDTDDLRRVWHAVDGDHGYSAPQTFAIYVAANGIALPVVMQSYDSDFPDPDEEVVRAIVGMHASTVDHLAPGGRVALMRARSGPPPMTELDRRWCGLLVQELGRSPVASFPLFFATDSTVRVVAPDDLVARAG